MGSLKLVLFDIDGTLLDTGGAGARSWMWAFEHAFDHPGVDIGKYSSAGMTDPVVARKTFTEAMGREPASAELTRLMGGGSRRHSAGHLGGTGRGCDLDRSSDRQIRSRGTARGEPGSRACLAGGAVPERWRA